MEYTIRQMTRAELDIAVDWAAAEGWNPGLNDADAFYETDAKGYWMGFLGDEPVGCISAVDYGERFGFIGFYIVRPDYRGKGYGYALWERGMQALAERNIGLDGVVAQQENYKKSGFTLAYRNIRYTMPASSECFAVSASLKRLSNIPFETVLAYDTRFFPEPRPRFLVAWFRQPNAHGYAAIQNGALTGYGMIRPCRNGFKIGPLFADDVKTADTLFNALCTHAAGQEVFLDTPEINTEAVALAERYEMTPMFETARMYTQAAPQLPLQQIFGVTTFELG